MPLMKFSDAKTISDALENKLISRKTKMRKKLNEPFLSKFFHYLDGQIMEEIDCKIITLKEADALLKTLPKKSITFRIKAEAKPKKQEVAETTDQKPLTKKDSCFIDAAKEINGNQSFEFIKTVHPGNEIADAFNNVFDSAKEITLYGELMHEGKALTNEMSELRVKIADLTQKLNDKEIVFQQNQKKIAEMKQILASNPLLKITEVSKKEEETNELKDKLERLESENKALKDRIGEGENFKTAAMFPNKKQYFVGDELKINNALGIALSRMAKKKGITISKVRSGAQEVGVYPIYLHNVLSAWIQNKERNEYMEPLQPYLKPEYKSTLNVTNYQPEYRASV